MKNTLIIFISGLLLCGCSQKRVTPAIDLIQVGTYTTWNHAAEGEAVLHVLKRTNSSIEGIRLVIKPSGQPETIITADTGTLAPGSFENAADKNSVQITLNNIQSECGTQHLTEPRFIYVLHH
jgi:hypothetical protein